VAADRLLLEEAGRNTRRRRVAALWIRRLSPEGIMVVLPSDHFVAPARVFRSALRSAVRAAARLGGLVTIGVPIRSPRHGFGTSALGTPRRSPGHSACVRVREKPKPRGLAAWRGPADTYGIAASRVEGGGDLEELAGTARRSWAAHSWRVEAGPVVDGPGGVLRRVPSLPIDRAVLEKSASTLVLRAPIPMIRPRELGRLGGSAA